MFSRSCSAAWWNKLQYLPLTAVAWQAGKHNQISADNSQQLRSELGEKLCKIFADGKESLLREPVIPLLQAIRWPRQFDRLEKFRLCEARKAINLALLWQTRFREGNVQSGTEDQKWCQHSWLYGVVSGCRSTSEGAINITNTKVHWRYLCGR